MIALKSRVRLHKSSIKARKGRWADVIGGGEGECWRVMVEVMPGNLHNDHRAAIRTWNAGRKACLIQLYHEQINSHSREQREGSL
jgi:hypothetical protein